MGVHVTKDSFVVRLSSARLALVSFAIVLCAAILFFLPLSSSPLFESSSIERATSLLFDKSSLTRFCRVPRSLHLTPLCHMGARCRADPTVPVSSSLSRSIAPLVINPSPPAGKRRERKKKEVGTRRIRFGSSNLPSCLTLA